jgi:hypothetical protein
VVREPTEVKIVTAVDDMTLWICLIGIPKGISHTQGMSKNRPVSPVMQTVVLSTPYHDFVDLFQGGVHTVTVTLPRKWCAYSDSDTATEV